MNKIIKTYSDLIKIDSFKGRFEYLILDAEVGTTTFGFDRYLNQGFYHSDEWKRIRDIVISRDFGCDLGLEGFEIHGKIYIHHMNPITKNDIVSASNNLYDPEFLICVSHKTHNAIHYGSYDILEKEQVERFPNDTCPWKILKG